MEFVVCRYKHSDGDDVDGVKMSKHFILYKQFMYAVSI